MSDLILTTPNGWRVAFWFCDAHNARLEVLEHVIINKVTYKVHGDVRDGQLLARPRRPEWGAPPATPSAHKKCYIEIGAIMPAVRQRMSIGTVTRDAMVNEVQATIARIEANMKQLAEARAALMALAEALSELTDAELTAVSSSRAREQIASYYERQQAMHIPHYVHQLEKALPAKRAPRAKVVR